MAKKQSADTPETAPQAAKQTPPPAEASPAPAAASTEPSVKKKGRQPGHPPRRGKKLRNLLKQQVVKITKEGPVPLRRALQVLKSLRKAKFDETVEVHMSLGIDPRRATR